MTELTTTTPPAPAAASAIPKHNAGLNAKPSIQQKTEHAKEKRISKERVTKPKLRLHAEELRHPSTVSFFTLVPDVTSKLDTALDNIIRYLYTSPAIKFEDKERSTKKSWPNFNPSVPPTRSVTLFLRDFSGVAYTTGTELDNDHKEIHLSLPYIKHCTTLTDPVRELAGVLTHELVHCYQHTTPPKTDDEPERKIPHPPGGLIEGIADFVRLKAHLDPPHWKKPQSASERASKWDAGYQNTAYFLAWIEDIWVGEGAIGMLNDRLLRVGYVGEEKEKEKSLPGEIGFWRGLFGLEVDELWAEYGKFLDDDVGN